MTNCNSICFEEVRTKPDKTPHSKHLKVEFLIAQQNSQELNTESKLRNLESQVENLESQVVYLGSEVSNLEDDLASASFGIFVAGVVCALWAQNTNRNAWLWFFLGIFFAPITLLVLLSKNSSDRQSSN